MSSTGFFGGITQTVKGFGQQVKGAAQKAVTAVRNPREAIREAQAAAQKRADVEITAEAYRQATGKALSASEKGTVASIIGITGGPTGAIGGVGKLLSILMKVGLGLTVVMGIVFLYASIDNKATDNLSFMNGTGANALVAAIVFGILTVLTLLGRGYMSTTGTSLDAVKATNVNSIFMLCLFSGIISLLWWLVASSVEEKTKAASEAETRASQLNAASSQAEGFQDGAATAAAAGARGGRPKIANDPEPTSLLNLQPMTIKQAGFFGPPSGGIFKPAEAVTQALRAGCRAFVLQIDYLNSNKDPATFEKAGEPTLIYTNNSGALISGNSGSIEAVATAIRDVAFNPMSPNFTKPVFLYLHVARAPSAVRESEKYMSFLSKIAKQLGPLAANHLGMSPLGNFHRQKNQDAILTAPISAFDGQVIIASNVNTDPFRAAAAGAVAKRYSPAEDLDYWVNLRVYLENDSESIGITQVTPTASTARAVIMRASSILPLKDQKADSFSIKGKQRFVIALPDAMRNPSFEELDHLLNTLGVNMVPLDIFSEGIDETKGLLKLYSNMSYREKPAALQKIAV